MNAVDLPEINWDRLRNAGDHVMPHGFRAHDEDGNPGPGIRLGMIDHGTRVVDAEGNRFLVMGWGSMQGTVVLRDRYRRMFMTDTDVRVWPVDIPQYVREALVIARRFDVRAESMGPGAWDCLLVETDDVEGLIEHLPAGSYEDPNPAGVRHTRVIVERS